MPLFNQFIPVVSACLILLEIVESFSSTLIITSGTSVSTKGNIRVSSRSTSFQGVVHHEIKALLKAEEPETEPPSSRRGIFQRTLAASGLFVTASLGVSRPSLALKERNEQLCATGFFTNFLEYRCTEIGDISDEGQKTTFSGTDAGAADSLLDKLNLMDTPVSTSDDTKQEGNQQARERENTDTISSKRYLD